MRGSSTRIFSGRVVFSGLLVLSGPLAGCGADEADSPMGTEPADVDGGGQASNEPNRPGEGVAPSIATPDAVVIDEEVEATFPVTSSGIRHFEAQGLPLGARLDAATGTITFRPDFTQSGSYDVAITGYAGGPPSTFHETVHVKIEVRDSIAPPAPVIVSTTDATGCKRLVVRQTTDAFLDSPGRAGRTFDAIVVIPNSASASASAPVVLSLHGFSGAPNAGATSSSAFRIEPHDPSNTYWWGYGESLPAAPPTAGHVPAYTERRVLHLIDWLLRTYPAADPDRVFATGGSMGGAGALTMGLLHARHFAGIEATIAQAIPRNHRPSRITQLSTLWGAPGLNLDGAWDTMDLTRSLRDDPEARDQFVFTKHGKDDGTIHFGAVVMPSPLTKKTFYAALDDEHIGHLSVWDEGAHGPADPVLPAGWWDNGWSRISDAEAYLTRRSAFPAFSHSSANDDPGNGTGNGKVPWNDETGYSAKLAVAGDTGWTGDIAGAINRFLRWDTKAIVDTRDHFAMPIRVVTSPGEPAPKDGYPTRRDLYTGALPIIVDVTPRRTQAFRPAPGEDVRFRFGALEGTVKAAADGSVTVRALAVSSTATVLELERDAP